MLFNVETSNQDKINSVLRHEIVSKLQSSGVIGTLGVLVGFLGVATIFGPSFQMEMQNTVTGRVLSKCVNLMPPAALIGLSMGFLSAAKNQQDEAENMLDILTNKV